MLEERITALCILTMLLMLVMGFGVLLFVSEPEQWVWYERAANDWFFRGLNQ